ncbi:vacuolar ATP synthase subunit c, putative [Plasmodium knowlesi strain H]|uniref:V-type proton ATPase subunit C n=3 Tax=Plasmodium knowlesi TaxID=5850 RepID=A0A5K1TY89_PLAKH|nr:V-type proton ATPase subunit C, putative [Plasmodium knowlesi strain H]OTN66529.1 V-type proton ATPase subunit C [Plasmodium knowlesi]CAA9986340.1 V-type proton ATPase subunit C, putative [Plasmodium knowlesi strain H]SBO25586.1 vacuolar ATP synthase subunit c, putative [Plasmodium knowlesi strain H]SBO28324.1 vacuolar ATP synthase subunit c, putative [Plasmodium knowlesi strain H]VVS75814.1 V-type proton ATPase subunit C, putative [Plasmodium knowlesi strain H]|eukprot:XP_002257745.1 vacuolar atp synthase, putative [Plasmodium knowlesi strain H]
MSESPMCLFIACSTRDNTSREYIYTILKNRLLGSHVCIDTNILDVPTNLKFCSFDDLLKCADDLQKYDSYAYGCLKKIEKLAKEYDENIELKIIYQRQHINIDQYIRRFTWDDAKYPRNRSLTDTIDVMVNNITKLSDEIHIKSSMLNDLKEKKKKDIPKTDTNNFFLKNLNEILTPQTVSQADFMETEYLTTLIAYIPKNSVDEWLASYEKFSQYVVPRSTEQFKGLVDKDGNTLWKVYVFKKFAESFKEAAKLKKFVVKSFKYDEQKYNDVMESRTKVEAEIIRQETFLRRMCLAAFSDIFSAFIHINILRVFCESVLRFGVPPNFASFSIRINGESKEKKVRKKLYDIFSSTDSIGKNYIKRSDENDEEIYPYVSVSFKI